MFIIYGLNKNTTKYAYVGLCQCPKCHNLNNFFVYEQATRPTLFFIPTIKIKSKYFLACSICKYGKELRREEANNYLTRSKNLPHPNVSYLLYENIKLFLLKGNSKIREYLTETPPEKVDLEFIAVLIKENLGLQHILTQDVIYVYLKTIKFISKSKDIYINLY